ncbi:hypothetical protein F4X86_02105 [Candidatus Saccharibacteria bacterium]|nr:hypothetical protein [Candidatus Saccharibacteria bacterium]
MGRKNHEMASGKLGHEEPAVERSVLGEAVEKQYRRLSSKRVDAILQNRSAEAYVQRLCGLAMYRDRDFSSEQLDVMVAAVGADFSAQEESNPDFWAGAYYKEPLTILSTALAGRHGHRLSEAQTEQLLEGHLAQGLNAAVLEPLITRHGKDLSAYAERLLESSGYLGHSLNAAIIEHYGSQLRPQLIDELLTLLIGKKLSEKESIESAILMGGEVDGWLVPYGRFAVVRDWEKEMLLNRRAEGIHGVFASIIQHGPELSPEQVDKLIESGYSLTHAQLLAFRFESLSPEQREAILSRTGPTDLFRQLVNNELPMPENKEALVDGVLKELGSLDWRQQDAMLSERYVGHFSTGDIDRLIESGSIVFKALASWPGELTPSQIDAIIGGQGSAIPTGFVRRIGSQLSPAQAEKILANSSKEVAVNLIHARPELFSVSDTEAKIDMLLQYCLDSTLQDWLIENYGRDFLPRQVDALMDNSYGSAVEEFIDSHPDKFSPEHIKKAISGNMVGINNRSRLFAMHRQAYLAEADELIESDSPLVAYLLEQCADELSSAQIDKLIERDDLFHTQSRILNYCGHRLSAEQIGRLMDMIKEGKGSSMYERVTKYEKEVPLLKKLVAVAGNRMTPAQIDRIINGRRHYQSELVGELLANHRDCLTEEQFDRIIARFGHVL